MNLALWLTRAGASHPHAPAVAAGTHVVRTYGELARRAARISAALRTTYRLSPGDRVAIAATNCVEYLEILYGIWHAGMAAVPANAKLHGAELGYILDHSGARVCFASESLVAALTSHAPRSLEHVIEIGSRDYQRLFEADPGCVTALPPDDLAWLFYTSGTTGRPKGAIITHRMLSWAAHAYATEVDSVSPGDAILHAAPMSHGSGLYIMPHVARLGINVIPESGGFDPDEVLSLVEAWPRSSIFAAPTMVKRLVECRRDFPPEHLRTIIWGGAPMYVEDALKALDRFGPRLAQIYGQGESPMTITTLSKQDIAARDHPRWRERLGSAGRPYACVEVQVVGGDGQPLPAGEAGEIAARGDVVMPGYWRNAEASAETLRGGWLHTGDVGSFDADGYLTIKDRSKDLIISGGSNIYPREVEEVLLKHPGVREVSVIGRRDPEWGEVVVAYVVGEAAPTDLDALCLASIARFKRPRHYAFVEALPKNNYGKILKTELRDRDAARARSAGTPPE